MASSHIDRKVLTAKYFSLLFFSKQKMERNTWTAKKNGYLLSYLLPKHVGSDLWELLYAPFWVLLQYLSLKDYFSNCFLLLKGFLLVKIISILTQRCFDLEKKLFQSLLGQQLSRRFYFFFKKQKHRLKHFNCLKKLAIFMCLICIREACFQIIEK